MMRGEVFFLLAILTVSIHGWEDKVLLEKVRSITFEEGEITNARRSSAIKQLQCVGGSAGCYGYRPKVVQCVNTGHDGYDVQWKCETPNMIIYQFGKIRVACEGYDYANDPYILRGSCGLKYELDYNYLVWLIPLVIFGVVLCCCLAACSEDKKTTNTTTDKKE